MFLCVHLCGCVCVCVVVRQERVKGAVSSVGPGGAVAAAGGLAALAALVYHLRAAAAKRKLSLHDAVLQAVRKAQDFGAVSSRNRPLMR